MGGFSMAELGLEEINLNESNGLLRNLSYIDKNGIEIVTYEKDDDGEWDGNFIFNDKHFLGYLIISKIF